MYAVISNGYGLSLGSAKRKVLGLSVHRLEVLLPVAQHRLQVFNGVRGYSGAAAHCERQEQRRQDRLQLLHPSSRTGNGGRPVQRTFALEGGPVRPPLLVSGPLSSRGPLLRHCSLGASPPPR